MKYPLSIENLIDAFSSLPTVGPKTAERYVFYLLKKNPEELKKFSNAILNLKSGIKVCRSCYSISESDPCSVCSDSKRDNASLCVLTGYRDFIAIESTGQYSGKYFILGGILNAIEGIKPEQIRVPQLLEKIKKENFKEIILAMNPDLEGETTAMYLTKVIKQLNIANIKVTRLAKGLPMGADLEYADDMTLANALKFRNEL